MMAARNGAEHVYAIEANRNLSELAGSLMVANGLDSKITIINELSTHVHADKEPHNLPKKGDVLVSEILGTLMLGESALTFVADCRDRLLKPDAQIIPAAVLSSNSSFPLSPRWSPHLAWSGFSAGAVAHAPRPRLAHSPSFLFGVLGASHAEMGSAFRDFAGGPSFPIPVFRAVNLSHSLSRRTSRASPR